jgi:hypothetical protein
MSFLDKVESLSNESFFKSQKALNFKFIESKSELSKIKIHNIKIESELEACKKELELSRIQKID